jgi:hypothetical protein
MGETYEEYVAIDVLCAATHRLKRSKAGAASGNTKVHQGSRNGRIVSWADQEGEGWQCRRAREGVSALGTVIGSAAYLCILGLSISIGYVTKALHMKWITHVVGNSGITHKN